MAKHPLEPRLDADPQLDTSANTVERPGVKTNKDPVKRKGSGSLLALSAAAMALPGIADKAEGAVPDDKITLGYRFSNYSEGDIDGNFVGESGRYDINVHQLHATIPFQERYQATVDIAIESMSGATPWVVAPGDNGELVQVMTGASAVEDQRTDIIASVTAYSSDTTTTVTGGLSMEDDYIAMSGGLGGSLELNDKHTILSTGVSFSIDEIEPTDGGTAFTFGDFTIGRVSKEEKLSVALYAGITQIIDRFSTIETGVGYKQVNGFLSDPYKELWINQLENNGVSSFNVRVADSRPDDRTIFTWTTRYRRFIPSWNAAWHLNYRFYDDDWEVQSHTFETSWYQNFENDWQVVPTFRFYTQSQAGFYAPFFTTPRIDRLGSSDYRLSGYGAITAKVQVNKRINNFKLVGTFEYYDTGDFGFDNSDQENPGLVDFMRLTVGFDYVLD